MKKTLAFNDLELEKLKQVAPFLNPDQTSQILLTLQLIKQHYKATSFLNKGEIKLVYDT